jgi:hypothetical protein
MEREEAYTGFWWRNLKERGQLEDPGANGRIILRWIFRQWDVVLWTGSICFKIGISGEHL